MLILYFLSTFIFRSM